MYTPKMPLVLIIDTKFITFSTLTKPMKILKIIIKLYYYVCTVSGSGYLHLALWTIILCSFFMNI